ncbi:MAG TPA: hypothetical protein VMJ10_32735 [Kofleriaceae bacterium]|nr:hypothetical protein [Kofleriaceae bacterium]
MEEAPLSAAHAHADPCALASAQPTSDEASRAIALVEALRRKKTGGGSPIEVIEAQDSLERRIRAHLAKGRVAVTLTDNRYTMISVRRVPKDRRYEVRLHHMFADADPVITRALAHYIADNDADASRVLGEFIDHNAGYVRGRARRQPTQVIFTAGEHHDLRTIFDDLNARYFESKIDAAITWGARTGRPRRRNSIKMGSYSVEDRLIRIHRSLDRAFVPRFFVAWIVFHEMLHQVHDIRVKNGRREFHSKAFLADEAMYEHYDQAKLWERRHLDALLTY